MYIINCCHYFAASLTSEVLKKLNISIENLPQKCQNLLQQTAESQSSLEIEQLDATSICLYRSKEISAKLEDDYEILKLKQKNAELQAKIDRNNKFLGGLRNELESSKRSLMNQTPNPENIQDHIRQIKQKLISYEESYEKAKSKYTVLTVPEPLQPARLGARAASLAGLRARAARLRQRADDVTLVREARDVCRHLRR
ncbi:unnamed protein product, partial [Brenthis ino]